MSFFIVRKYPLDIFHVAWTILQIHSASRSKSFFSLPFRFISGKWLFLLVCLSTSRCNPVRGGRLPVALLATTLLRAFGEPAGEPAGAEGWPQESGEAKEGLLASATGPASAATLEGAEQGPGQVVRLHTRWICTFSVHFAIYQALKVERVSVCML